MKLFMKLLKVSALITVTATFQKIQADDLSDKIAKYKQSLASIRQELDQCKKIAQNEKEINKEDRIDPNLTAQLNLNSEDLVKILDLQEASIDMVCSIVEVKFKIFSFEDVDSEAACKQTSDKFQSIGAYLKVLNSTDDRFKDFLTKKIAKHADLAAKICKFISDHKNEVVQVRNALAVR